jgi:hypothetical protein
MSKIEEQNPAPIIARAKITPLAWAWRFSALILWVSFCKLNMVKGVKGLNKINSGSHSVRIAACIKHGDGYCFFVLWLIR